MKIMKFSGFKNSKKLHFYFFNLIQYIKSLCLNLNAHFFYSSFNASYAEDTSSQFVIFYEKRVKMGKNGKNSPFLALYACTT
jgi:hypothetical protein